jgi:hypothetical protein
MDDWADLFDRAADHGSTVAAVREALADRRATGEGG